MDSDISATPKGTAMSDIARYAAAPAPAPFGRLSRVDREATMQARRDYNSARLAMHRAELEGLVERTRANVRKDLVQHAMRNAQEVDMYARAMSGGHDALAMTLGDLQAAYNQGELIRVVKRGVDG